MPRYYQPYSSTSALVIEKGKKLSDIQKLKPQQVAIIEKWIRDENKNPDDVVFVPLMGKFNFGLVMLDAKTGEIVGMEGIDPTWY